MPKISIYQRNKKERLEQEAFKYYQQGLTTRQVSNILKELGTPRSYQWVAEVVKKLSTRQNLTIK